jgi:hypothetical protein
MAHKMKVVKGLSKFNLMMALFDEAVEHMRKDAPPGRKFTITLQDHSMRNAPRDYIVIITSVEAEDGSRTKWNIKGLLVDEGDMDGWKSFVGFVSTADDRSGTITIFE